MIRKTSRTIGISALFLTMASAPLYAGDWMKSLGDFGANLQKEVAQPATSSSAPVASSQTSGMGLSQTDMIAGLKDALKVGSTRVVQQVSQTNGFNADANIHIPLPSSLQAVKSTLTSIGMGTLVDDLELKLNRAAEAATPKAKQLFVDAIKGMNIVDAKNILSGPNDAATQYFKGKMSQPLAKEMQPVIANALSEVGAIQAYDAVIAKYKSIPFVPDVKAQLNDHVVNGALKGVFYYMAKEEAGIRKEPVKRTTSILKKVFSQI